MGRMRVVVADRHHQRTHRHSHTDLQELQSQLPLEQRVEEAKEDEEEKAEEETAEETAGSHHSSLVKGNEPFCASAFVVEAAAESVDLVDDLVEEELEAEPLLRRQKRRELV